MAVHHQNVPITQRLGMIGNTAMRIEIAELVNVVHTFDGVRISSHHYYRRLPIPVINFSNENVAFIVFPSRLAERIRECIRNHTLFIAFRSNDAPMFMNVYPIVNWFGF